MSDEEARALGLDEVTELDIDMVAATMGLPQNVADFAKKMIAEGMECDRCGTVVRGEDLSGMFSFVADSPLMPTPSPPTILCQRCGYLTAAFMGIQAAKEVCERRGWS